MISANVVTADLSANGSLTTGNSAINGGLGTVTLATNTIIGGTLSNPGTLYISSNTIYGNGLFQFVEFSANASGGFANVNAILTFSPTSIISGNLNFSNTINVAYMTTSNGIISTNGSKIGSNTLNVTGLNLYSNQTGLNVYSNNNAAVNAYSTSGTAGQFVSDTGSSLIAGNTSTMNFQVYANGVTFANNLLINNFNSGGLVIGNTVFTVNTVVTGNVSVVNVFANGSIYSNGTISTLGEATFGNNVGISGNVVPSTTNTYILGTVAKNWKNGYFDTVTFGSATINSSSYSGVAADAVNFGGHPPAYYPNTSIYPGAFNGTTITASGVSILNGLLTANAGLIANNYDTLNRGQVVLQNNANNAILRNDGTSLSILASNNNNAYTTLRPFTVNLGTGAVSIDGTGVGTTIGGAVSVTGAATLSGGFSGVHSTTNIGNTASQSVVTLSSNAAWTTLPIGYAGYIANTSSYVPVAQYGYFTKTGIKDANSGWGGIYLNADQSQAYWGGTLLGTNSPTWKNIVDSGNFNTYSPTLGGVGATGTWGISISGVAATATLADTATNALSLGGVTPAYYALLASPTFSGTLTTPTLAVTANETVGGTLGVTGVTSLTTLNVSANETVTGNLVVNGYMQGALMSIYNINAGGTYLLVSTNFGQVVVVNSTADVTIQLPTLTAGGRLMVTRIGTGAVTLVGTTATLSSRTGGFSVVNRYGSVSIFYTSVNSVVVDGNI